MIEKQSKPALPYEQPAQFLKVLTHPARLAILELLRDGEHCVCHMEAHLGCRQAYLSQQLAVLREAGLLQDRREGWNIFYRVADARVFALLDWVYTIAGGAQVVENQESVSCPCPHCQASKIPQPEVLEGECHD